MVNVTPVAWVKSSRTEPIDDAWGAVSTRIELDPAYPDDALDGLDGFSHVEVIFLFHRVTQDEIVTGARHPRGNRDWPAVGIFAQRGKGRPNRLGLTTARLVAREGRTLIVRDLDAIDGTPVLDLKPVMREFLPRGDVHQPEWASELMARYWEG